MMVCWRVWQCENGDVVTEGDAAQTAPQLRALSTKATGAHAAAAVRGSVSQGRQQSRLQLQAADHRSGADLPPPALRARGVAADALAVAQVGEGPRRAPGLQVPRHPHGRAHLQPVVHAGFGEVIV